MITFSGGSSLLHPQYCYPAGMAQGQPNFLFLITDQHRADHVGFGGNATVKTPHLDMLASRGTVFRRAYVANPICMPNRASILTGRMPSVHGTRFNGISLNWRANTFVRRLRKAGYRTTHIGKSHLQNMCVNRRRVVRLVDFTFEEEALLPADADGWDELENYQRYRTGDEPQISDFYGFERAAFAILHGDQVTGHYEGWLKGKGFDPSSIQGPGNALERYDGYYQVYKTATPAEVYPSNYVADMAVAEIEAATRESRPFFVHASWPDPHHPFTPPGEYYDMYSPSTMELPASFGDRHDDSMPHYRKMIANRGQMVFHNVDGWAPTEEQFRHAVAAEYGNISLIDDCVGRILAALDRSGARDNTIVVFTSDHGDMFGDHGIMFKHAMHYNGCIRVPLVLALPGQEGRHCDELVSSIDIAPTLLELAGVPAYHGMQGHSLVSLLAMDGKGQRTAVYIEEDQKEDMTGAGVSTRMRTIVTDEGRLTLYQGHEHGELFAGDDKLEMRNLFNKPQGHELQHHLLGLLTQAMMAHAETSPRPTHNA